MSDRLQATLLPETLLNCLNYLLETLSRVSKSKRADFGYLLREVVDVEAYAM